MFRVVWQYGKHAMGALNSLNVPAPFAMPGATQDLFAGIPLVGAPEPVFTRQPLALRSRLLAMPAPFAAAEEQDLAGYRHVFVTDASAARLLADRLKQNPDVVYADVQPRLEPAFIVDEARRKRAHERQVHAASLVPSATPNLRSRQFYLGAAPDGVDALYAWSGAGGKGAAVTIVDIEDGWNFLHEDLGQSQIGVIYGVNSDSDHGTAVLGIIGGDENTIGVSGLVPEATTAAASARYDWNNGKWNAADVIEHMVERLRPGDIILLEMHSPGPRSIEPYPSQQGFLPVEYWEPEYAAIRYAVAKGIFVVEAAGNGGENLDHPAYGGRLSRATRDSGAILVGGGASPLQQYPRSRIWWSNYGTRLDVQGCGEDLVTTGGRSEPVYHDLIDHPEASRCYTQSFGGTSGASPIVVGVIAAIVGRLKAAGRPLPTPDDMRRLLVETGTSQAPSPESPDTQRIGPLPDVRRALQALGL